MNGLAVVEKASIRFIVKLDEEEHKISETVKIKFILKNIGDKTITLIFPTSQIFDFLITDIDGKYIYQWSSGKIFLPVVTHIELKRGESIQRVLEWIPSGPSIYILKGFTKRFYLDGETLKLEAPPLRLKINLNSNRGWHVPIAPLG